MKISILYFEGCPNHPPTVEMVQRLVGESGLDAEVEEVEVTNPDDARRQRFLGSPTVQVDAVDIEPAARARTDFGMSCRLYDTPDGLPSQEMLRAALGVGDARSAANSDPLNGDGVTGDRAGMLAVGGSVVMAMLSSACCWVPLLLLAFGASAAGFSAFFVVWRPVFIIVAVFTLGLGFYLAFVGKPTCADACCPAGAARRRRFRRVSWCVSAAIVAGFVLLPNYLGLLIGGSSASAAAHDTASGALVFDIEGMHCVACAARLKAELAELAGVHDVQVDFATKTARIAASDESITPRVIEATQHAGFLAALRIEAH